MNDYIVCHSDNINMLQSSVTALINNGYEISGSLVITPGPYENNIFWQPVVKISQYEVIHTAPQTDQFIIQ